MYECVCDVGLYTISLRKKTINGFRWFVVENVFFFAFLLSFLRRMPCRASPMSVCDANPLNKSTKKAHQMHNESVILCFSWTSSEKRSTALNVIVDSDLSFFLFCICLSVHYTEYTMVICTCLSNKHHAKNKLNSGSQTEYLYLYIEKLKRTRKKIPGTQVTDCCILEWTLIDNSRNIRNLVRMEKRAFTLCLLCIYHLKINIQTNSSSNVFVVLVTFGSVAAQKRLLCWLWLAIAYHYCGCVYVTRVTRLLVIYKMPIYKN